jgi:D-glycero-alpha-D-manno-heptose 1-phosphate guanylyltransferase
VKAIILAGGKGTRLMDTIGDIPKPMAPIDSKPFLEYLIRYLHKFNVEEIVISIGYKSEIIKSYFGSGEKLSIAISYCEENEPLGTGGAIKKSLEDVHDENVIVMNGDSFLEMNYDELVAFHKEQSAMATIGLISMEDAGRYGAVEANSKREILSFKEKGSYQPGLINGGIYILNSNITDYIPDGPVSLEKEVFPFLVGKGLYGITVSGIFVDIGVPADYLQLRDNPDKLTSIFKKTGAKKDRLYGSATVL